MWHPLPDVQGHSGRAAATFVFSCSLSFVDRLLMVRTSERHQGKRAVARVKSLKWRLPDSICVQGG